MSAEEPKESAIRKVFSRRISKLKKDHPWVSLWIIRFIQYFVLFCVVIIPGYLLFREFNLAPTGIENARYFLSAMVQAQAAIVSLVVTLTLIAIQMAAASYTPRVVDVMKKNPDMWFLLIIYLSAISYGFIVLKLVGSDPDPVLVSSVLIIGIYTFSILFLYMRNTISQLRPDEVVKMLVGEINVENIYQKEWTDDIMQPVFDVVHASIMRYDVTTTRTGLNKLSERISELFLSFDPGSREKTAESIMGYFCYHIKRSSLVALRNDDEEMFIEIIDILDKFGKQVADKELTAATERLAWTLAYAGCHTADKGLKEATETVAKVLGDIGSYATDKGLNVVPARVALGLELVGNHAVDKELEMATNMVVWALEDIGIHAVNKGLEEAIYTVTWALENVGSHAAYKGLEAETYNVVDALREIGNRTVDKEMREATEWVAEALWNIGSHAAYMGLRDATNRVAWALGNVGDRAADKGLKGAVDIVVRGLCRIGCKEFGRDDTAKSLASLLFRDKDRVTKLIDDFISKLNSNEKEDFGHFMDMVNEELKILESSDK